ncbi:MAG: MBL fold metallo-hydrolase [Gammaproteobacteria bacterium]|nr:MBL fold metallo-hydrolase [Gammaproteobacteria bacterium]
MNNLRCFFISTVFMLVCTNLNAEWQPSKITQVAMLGTGTPEVNPERSGPSLAIIVNDTPYIVDFGPGVVRRAAALTPRYGGKVKALTPKNIKTAFLTHLHSDHTVGYPDLIFTPWTLERNSPLRVVGPEGIESMTKHILKAYDHDIKYRLYGAEPANNKGWRVDVTTINKDGLVYQDENVKVEAFKVKHGSWPNAYGYRFTTPDKVIVISGDAAKTEKIAEYAKGADMLIHEVFSDEGCDFEGQFWCNYHRQNHTSTYELADIANKAMPKLLVLYHVLFLGHTEEELLKEIRSRYKGDVIMSQDLDVY